MIAANVLVTKILKKKNQIMKFRSQVWAMICLLVTLAGCSGSESERYIGYWAMLDKEGELQSFFEIKGSNEQIIIEQNEYGTLGPQGGNEDIVLVNNNGTLVLHNQFPIALSDDQQSLILTGIGTANRLTQAEFKELMEIERQDIADTEKCKELNEGHRQENPLTIADFNLRPSNEERRAEELRKQKSEQITEKYRQLAKEAGLENCQIRAQL